MQTSGFLMCWLLWMGFHFDGNAHQIRLSWTRVWRLRYAIEYVLKRGFASGHDIQVLLGHITWAVLLRREALSILSSCYAFARLGDGDVRLWASVSCELRQIVSLLPLFICDTGIVWSTKVFCTDSKERCLLTLLLLGDGRVRSSDIASKNQLVLGVTL